MKSRLPITNHMIADQFELLSKLSDLHGENSFKVKSYANASFTLSKLHQPLADLPFQEIAALKGIGESTAKKIVEILETGQLEALTQLIAKTPAGVLDMMQIKGLGPKKLSVIWKEMEIESIGELLYACEENRLTLYKGFGAKTQANVKESIQFFLSNQGNFLFAQLEWAAAQLETQWAKVFPSYYFLPTGSLRRQQTTVQHLEWVSDVPLDQLKPILAQWGATAVESSFTPIDAWLPDTSPQDLLLALKDLNNIQQTHVKLPEGLSIFIYSGQRQHLPVLQWITTGPASFLQQLFENKELNWKEILATTTTLPTPFEAPTKEEAIPSLSAIWPSDRKILTDDAPQWHADRLIFDHFHLPYPQPWLRENEAVLEWTTKNSAASLLKTTDIKGIIHSHSTWSDGAESIRQMAEAAKAAGLEYLVISDHSQTAFYANGLKAERVLEQHKEIDELNKQLAPFKIFKSIESDILNDGSLDYPIEVLAQFDLVIASVHSNLRMPQEKAMERLLAAIHHPYTTILGHPTGRLLLSRNGYPIDHRVIIDACIEKGVVIEINAHPRRLDLDWKWIGYAMEKGALLSVNPDAHAVSGYSDVHYGVLAARKGFLTPERNLSSFSLPELEAYLEQRKRKIST